MAASLRSLAPYKWRLTGAVLGVLAYAFLVVVAIAGASPLAQALIALPVIAALIAGGNYLQQWLGITRPAPKFARPARKEDATEGRDAESLP